MKRIRKIQVISIFLIVPLIFMQSHLNAQEQTAADNKLQSTFGIKGGVNLTNLYVDETSDEHMKLGFNAGLFAKLAVARGFSIQPELLYSVKGAKERYDNFVLG